MAQRLDYAGNEWTFDLLREVDNVLHDIAKNKYKLDTYPNQIEVISAEQMLDAYSSGAMPVMYPHWSFGKSFSVNEHLYETGQQNLAYEVVINFVLDGRKYDDHANLGHCPCVLWAQFVF